MQKLNALHQMSYLRKLPTLNLTQKQSTVSFPVLEERTPLYYFLCLDLQACPLQMLDKFLKPVCHSPPQAQIP